MNILWLGPERAKIFQLIRSYGDTIIQIEEQLYGNEEVLRGKDFLISYGYRYILPDDVLNSFKPNHRINLHISFLPWNRGADPNLWSFLEDTPKGVSIHLLSSQLDKGDLIVQEEVEMDAKDTLRSSYEKLSICMERLFISNWTKMRIGAMNSFPQQAGGSYHSSKDKQPYNNLLYLGWETPVKELIAMARK